MTINAIDILTNGAPWSITPEMMETIQAIANRQTSPEAVAAELGRPLKNTREVMMRGSVAVIPVEGPLFPKANLFTEVSGATSIEMLALDFNRALNDDQIKSIVLDFSTSPGGQTIGINEFAGMVRGSGKTVIAYIGGMAASAAYWIASAADKVVVDRTAMVGNIGVVTGQSRRDDDGGIEIVSSRAPDKRPDASTEDGLAVIQSMVDSIEDVFLQTVASNRGITVEAVASLRGRIVIGQEAIDAGLADEIGSLESVIAGLSGNFATNGGNMPNAKKGDQPDTSEKPEITLAIIASDHPKVYKSIFDAGSASIDVAGIQKNASEAECSRIQAVEAQAMAGHEGLIAGLKFDGKTTGEQAAFAVLKAEKGLRSQHLQSVKDREKPLPPLADTEVVEQSAKTMAKEARAMVTEAESKGQKLSVSQAMAIIKKNGSES